ncbi:MAG: hypothetical protein WAM02_08800, partial [Candidatus Cybelea sp.]
MNTAGFVKYAAALIALAICSACGGAPPVAPSSAALGGGYTARVFSVNGRLVTAAHANLSALRYATMVPSRHAKSKYFEYITYGTNAGIFDYPKSDRQIGTIANAGGGQECTNVLF